MIDLRKLAFMLFVGLVMWSSAQADGVTTKNYSVQTPRSDDATFVPVGVFATFEDGETKYNSFFYCGIDPTNGHCNRASRCSNTDSSGKCVSQEYEFHCRTSLTFGGGPKA